LAVALTQAATIFDTIAYGHAIGSAEQYNQLAELDRAALTTSPDRSSSPDPAGEPAATLAGVP
jgi:hypothetical protein